MKEYVIVSITQEKQTVVTKITGYDYKVSFEDMAVNALDVYKVNKKLPSQLLEENREMKECLKYAIIMLPDGQVKKDCEQTLKSLEQ